MAIFASPKPTIRSPRRNLPLGGKNPVKRHPDSGAPLKAPASRSTRSGRIPRYPDSYGSRTSTSLISAVIDSSPRRATTRIVSPAFLFPR